MSGAAESGVAVEAKVKVDVSWCQAVDKDCAVNSVANGCIALNHPLTDDQYQTLLNTVGGYRTLRAVSGALSSMKGRPISMKKVPVSPN